MTHPNDPAPSATARRVATAYVRLDPGPVHVGAVQRFSPRRIEVHFKAAIPMPLGERVSVRFAENVDGESGLVGARPVARTDDLAGSTFLLECSPTQEELDRLPAKLRPFFELRKSRRVTLGEPVVCHLGLGGSSKAFPGKLMDLSETGARVFVPVEAESSLAAHSNAVLTFAFGATRPFSFRSYLRRRRLDVGRVEYGLQFDVTNTPNGAESIQRLLSRITS